MNLGFWTLRRKVFLTLIVGALAPLALTGALVVARGRALLEHDARSRLRVLGDAAADRIDALNHRYFDLLAGLRRLPAVQSACAAINRGQAPDPAAAEAMAILAQSDSALHAISLTDRGGRIAITTIPAYQGFDVTRRGYYHAARARPGPAVELMVPSRVAGTGPIHAFAQALGGEVEPCVLVIGAKAERLRDRVRELHGALGAGSFLLVLDERGIRIADSLLGESLFRPAGPLPHDEVQAMVAARRFGEDTEALLTNPLHAPNEFERARAPTLAPGADVFQYDAPSGGGRYMAVARRLGTARWTVFVLVPTSTIYAPSRALTRTTLLIGLVTLGALLAVALLLSRRIVAPMRALAVAADAVAKGKLDTRVTAVGRDEVALAASRFNEMAASIEHATHDLERKVAERTELLSGTNQQLRAAGEELRAQQAELVAQKAELQAQRDRLEEQHAIVARADRTKSEFLANMSHELRTPLNAVIGFADLLQVTAEDRLEPAELSQLRDITSAGKHLLLIINDILDLAKIDSGTVRLDLETLDPAGVIADSVAMAQAIARGRRIELRTTVRTRRAVTADSARLRQVLLNLISNAVKFSPAGSAVDIVATDAGEHVRFAVTDRGPGIAPDLIQRLFTPFVQGEGALHKTHQGTGLGLAISKKLVELHGGTIELDSKVGVGTTAIVRLPAAGRRMRASAPPSGALAVLLVEGGGGARPTRARLEAAGYQVRVAGPGEDVAAAAAAAPPALVVIDAPDGHAADDRLFEQATRLSATMPVLLCSDEPQVLAAKPIDAAALRTLCRRLTAAAGRTARVLVVDDDPSVLTVATAALGDGYALVAATTKAEGFARAIAERFDLIIVDLGLPDGSGLDLLDALAEHDRTRTVPRIVLTAAELDAEQLARLRRHAAAVAQKGAVTPDELLAVVERLTRPAPALPASPAIPTILVVDDNDMNRDLMRSILERLGYAIVQARDGIEALAIAERDRPALILLDLAMPGMDGFETTRQVRARPELQAIPIVAVSALARRSDEDDARAAGVDDFLTKPIDRVALERLVARFVPR